MSDGGKMIKLLGAEKCLKQLCRFARMPAFRLRRSQMPESESVHIARRVNSLKLKSAQRFNISPEKCHVGHVVLQAMLDHPNDLNQVDAVTEIRQTNGEVASVAIRLASAFRHYGLNVGDVIAIMGPNHNGLAVPYYASHFNGHTICTIDAAITLPDLQVVFSNISPKMIFCLTSQADNAKEALKQNGINAHIVLFDGDNENLESFIRNHKGTDVNFRPTEFDQSRTVAWLMLTSGTTGRPKAAMVPYDTLLNAICCWWAQFIEKWELTLTIGTIQWMSAMMFYISGPLMGFGRVQSSIPLTPQSLVGIINKYKPNVTVWTPHLLSKFIHATFDVCDLSCFKYIGIGGSSIEKSLLDQFRKKCSAYLYLIYGMTELMVPVFDFNKNTPFGSSGKPFEKFQYKLVNDAGKVSEVNEPGELWIKGDEFFKGYLNNPEETSAVISEDGWVKTGDIFYKDEHAHYYYVERKRLLIKHTGQWISPIQLEEVINKIPGISEVCVVGIPDTLDVEVPVAAIVKKSSSSVEPEEVFSFMKKELPPLKQLHGGLFFLDSLPVTPSGKIHRAKTREIAFLADRILPAK